METKKGRDEINATHPNGARDFPSSEDGGVYILIINKYLSNKKNLLSLTNYLPSLYKLKLINS